ncbi:hypothetical protein BTVI_13494 [Pitangus sulphuratus]|nr:hypothetical protein BTVI_13494 [Pitangus sulphuratus]
MFLRQFYFSVFGSYPVSNKYKYYPHFESILPVKRKSERATLVATWNLARVNPLQGYMVVDHVDVLESGSLPTEVLKVQNCLTQAAKQGKNSALGLNELMLKESEIYNGPKMIPDMEMEVMSSLAQDNFPTHNIRHNGIP